MNDQAGEASKHVPLFQAVLRMKMFNQIKSRYGRHFGFFRESKKFIIDAAEFKHWMQTNERTQAEEHQLLSLGNYRTYWVELFDLKEFAVVGLQMGQEGWYVRGIGLDLGKREICCAYYTDEDEIIQFDVRSLDEPTIELMRVAHYLVGVASYLRVRHVAAERKSLPVGVKIKHGKRKSITAEYSVCYLKQPSEREPAPRNSSEARDTPEWQHRWKVRGHWRKVTGVGKDPEGMPVLGYTWVKAFVKGPEDKPLLDRPTIALNRLPGGYKEVAKERV